MFMILNCYILFYINYIYLSITESKKKKKKILDFSYLPTRGSNTKITPTSGLKEQRNEHTQLCMNTGNTQT